MNKDYQDIKPYYSEEFERDKKIYLTEITCDPRGRYNTEPQELTSEIPIQGNR